MGRNEVLQHAHAFLEVGKNRVFDNLGAFGSGFLGLGHQTTHTGKLADLSGRTTGSGIQHHIYGIETLVGFFHGLHQDLGKVIVDVCPSIDDLVITFVVRDETHTIIIGNAFHFFVSATNQFLFFFRNDNITQVERQTAHVCHTITQILDTVQEFAGTSHTYRLDHVGDDAAQSLFGNDVVEITDFFRYDFVDNHTAYGRFHHLLFQLAIRIQVLYHNFNRRMNVYTLLIVGNDSLFGTIECQTFALRTGTELGNIIQAQHHILRRHRNRRAVCRIQDIVRLQHQNLRFQNRFVAQRQMHSHLVTVEVGIERRTGQRMQLDSLTFYHLRLESLDTQAVQCRSTVQQYRVSFHHVFQNIPNHRLLAVYNLLGRLQGLHDTAFYKLTDDERLIKFCGHQFRQTAFSHLQLRSYNDYRTG